VFQLEHISDLWLCVRMFQLEHKSGFYRNTVEISEKSENHLKAIVERREVAGGDGVGDRAGKVAEKTRGEGKATRSEPEAGSRGWEVLIEMFLPDPSLL
jgi:hypothetical protein